MPSILFEMEAKSKWTRVCWQLLPLRFRDSILRIKFSKITMITTYREEFHKQPWRYHAAFTIINGNPFSSINAEDYKNGLINMLKRITRNISTNEMICDVFCDWRSFENAVKASTQFMNAKKYKNMIWRKLKLIWINNDYKGSSIL
jgi:hypothetical protein